MKAEIKKWGINGEGITYADRKPVFIPYAIPGEIVDFHEVKKEDRYSIGEVDRLLERSNLRKPMSCKKGMECGGCSLMHVLYKGQYRMKEQILRESLLKYAGYKGKIEPIIKNPNPLGYRNACKLPFGMELGELVTGMYSANSRKFVPIEKCIVHSKYLEWTRQTILEILNKYHCQAFDTETRKGFRYLVMKEFHQKIQVILVTGDDELEENLVQDLLNIEEITSLWQSKKLDDTVDVFGTEMIHLGKEKTIMVEINGLKLMLDPKSFFQLNTEQAAVLYNVVKQNVRKTGRIVEAYCGIGGISLMVKNLAREVIGIEYVEPAVENASENAKINRAGNVHFRCGDAAEKLKEILEQKKVNTLIVDPPRSGLDKNMREVIRNSEINSIIYVSCNPSTLAKDIKDLQNYRIRKVQPLDMFSQTSHVETVVLMSHTNEGMK